MSRVAATTQTPACACGTTGSAQELAGTCRFCSDMTGPIADLTVPPLRAFRGKPATRAATAGVAVVLLTLLGLGGLATARLHARFEQVRTHEMATARYDALQRAIVAERTALT